MALVLRKAVLPKNATFLKCLKGRPLATATNKKNAAPISKAATLRPMREQPQKVVTNIQLIGLKTMTQQAEDPRRKRNLARKSFSCPCFSQRNDFEPCVLSKMRSSTSINEKSITKNKFHILRQFCPQRASSTIATRPSLESLNLSNQIKEACAVCACPPPGGCCLPPPCNAPAKCLQHITGYYYYPYGTWFCGPYHIRTGPCGPCAGPVQPGGPCGPAPPNPGGPCGPSGVVLCGPGASCAQCRYCPCAPCGPCGPGCCGFCGPCSCGPCTPCCGPWYDPCSPCGLPGACAPCGACGTYSICNGPSGPCFNVPCVPIEVSGPVRPGGPCGPTLSSPFDLCARCCLFATDPEIDTYPFKSLTSDSSYGIPCDICSTLEENNSPISEDNQPMLVSPSRMNIYPSLNLDVVDEPLSKLQVRYFSTMKLRSGLVNDLLKPKSNQMDILKAKMSTYSKCCHGLCCNCHLLCNNKAPGCFCPPLCKPRYIPSKEERDQPYIPPNCFCYSNTPNYRNPAPYPNPGTGIHDGYLYKRPWHPC